MQWNRQEPFQREKPIVAFVDGVETPHSIMLSGNRIGINSNGKKVVPEGLFVCRMGSEFHFLPRTNVSSAFSTGSTIGTIALPYLFLPGDVLSSVEGQQVATIGGSWMNNDTLTVTLSNGIVRTIPLGYTTGSPTAITTDSVASIIANFLNTDAVASDSLMAIAVASIVYIYGKNGSTPNISFTDSGSGTVTLTSRAAFFTIGTILNINYTTGAITLNENAAFNVPVGSHIGVVVDEVYGVYPHALDMTGKKSTLVAPVAGSCGIYEGALPYIDGELKARFPKSRFAIKF